MEISGTRWNKYHISSTNGKSGVAIAVKPRIILVRMPPLFGPFLTGKSAIQEEIKLSNIINISSACGYKLILEKEN